MAKNECKLLPTRGNIRFIGSYYPQERDCYPLQGYLTPTIAAKTKHSKEAVDRYIRDYEIVKTVRAATDDIDKISQITRLSKRVISQYLDLIPQHLLKDIDTNLATKSKRCKDTNTLASSKPTGGKQ